MSRPRGLGRGLDALLGAEDTAPKDALATLPLTAIDPGRYQPRTKMDDTALAELAASIRAQGVMQPVLVRPREGGRYELIAGERRWRAARLAGLGEIPALVREVPDEAALAMALIENIQREDLNPIEEATGLQRLVDEFRMTHEQIADAIGRSRRRACRRRTRSTTCRATLCRSATPSFRRLTGRARSKKPRGSSPARKKRTDRDLARLEEEVSGRLGTTVEIHAGRKGRGKIVLHYSGIDHLEQLLKKLR